MTATVLTPVPGMCPATGEPAETLAHLLLMDVVERIAANPSHWEGLVGDGSKTSWRPVSVREDVDVWLVTWPTFATTRLHSHDEVSTAFRTIRGVLTEIRPDDRGRLIPSKYEPGLTGLIRPGEIHDLRNELAGPAVTVHAYTRGLRSMTYYDWAGGSITESSRVTARNCAGAHNWPGA